MTSLLPPRRVLGPGKGWGLGRAGSGGRSPRVHGCPPRLAWSPEASRRRSFVGASRAPAVCREGHPPRCAHHQASALRSRVCLLHPRHPLGIALVPKDTDAGDSPSLGPAVAGEAEGLGASLPLAPVREQAGPLSPLRLHPSEPSATRAPTSREEAAHTSSAGDRGHRLRAVPRPANRLTPPQASPDSQVPSLTLEIKVTFGPDPKQIFMSCLLRSALAGPGKGKEQL